jgi:hypothetical protein
MLSFKLHPRIGEQDLLLPCTGHIVFTTVAGQGWLAGHIALSGCIWTYSRPRSDIQAFECSEKVPIGLPSPAQLTRDRHDSTGRDRPPKQFPPVRRLVEGRMAPESRKLALGNNHGACFSVVLVASELRIVIVSVRHILEDLLVRQRAQIACTRPAARSGRLKTVGAGTI